MKLRDLLLDNCDQLRDLTPLKGMPLTKLTLYGCSQVTDLTPLQGMSLVAVSVTPKTLPRSSMDLLRRMKSLTTILAVYDFQSTLAAEEFWKWFDMGEFSK